MDEVHNVGMHTLQRFAYLGAVEKAEEERRKSVVTKAMFEPKNTGRTYDELDLELGIWLRSKGYRSVTQWQISFLLGLRLEEWYAGDHPYCNPISLRT